MIIEFAGLPGSGKSTIVQRLAEQSGVSSQVVAPRGLGVAKHPLMTFGHVLHPGAWGLGSGWPAWVALWLRSVAQDGIRDGADVTHLLEEGYVHHLWRAMFLHPRLTQAPWRNFPLVPVPLIVLELDRASRFARVSAKPAQGKVNRQLATAGPTDPVWDRAETLFEMIIAEAAVRRPVIRVSTAGSIAEASTRVREAIAALWVSGKR